FECMSVGSRGGGGSTTEGLDSNGRGRIRADSFGLWRIAFKYRDSPIKSIPLHPEPYYSADGVIAVSPRLPADHTEPTRLKARRCDPGSVVVELRDLTGRP